MKAPTKFNFRALASKIHPQLPLDPRQSQRLLAVLKTSFQNELDLVHPAPGASITSRRTDITPLASDANDRPQFYPSQPTAAQHLQRILSNPLLGTRPDPNSFIFGGETHRVSSQPVLPGIKDTEKWFTDHVACGSADLFAAKAYLLAVSDSRNLRGANLRKYLAETQAGSRVSEWLSADPAHLSSEFWSDLEFCGLLTKCLVAEGRHVDIQKLMIMPSPSQITDIRADLTWRRCLVKNWVAASLLFEEDISQIVQRFLHNVRVFQQTGPTTYGGDVRHVLSSAGNCLAAAMTTPRYHVATETFDTFVKSLPFWAADKSLAHGLLPLHHPTKPNAKPVVSFLKIKLSGKFTTRMPQSLRLRTVQMCLDATHLSLATQDYTSGKWLLEYAKNNFPHELGIDNVSIPKEGASIIRQFNSLIRWNSAHIGGVAVG